MHPKPNLACNAVGPIVRSGLLAAAVLATLPAESAGIALNLNSEPTNGGHRPGAGANGKLTQSGTNDLISPQSYGGHVTGDFDDGDISSASKAKVSDYNTGGHVDDDTSVTMQPVGASVPSWHTAVLH